VSTQPGNRRLTVPSAATGFKSLYAAALLTALASPALAEQPAPRR
jgi:hypothetical protein